MKTIKAYKAQALAIIMVILVISSIIGFSVFSRQVNQKRTIVEERNSAEAIEVADIILDNFLLSTTDKWVEKMEEGKEYIESKNGGNEKHEITDLTDELGNILDLQNLSICPLKAENTNTYTLKLSRTDDDTIFYLRPGETFVFPINGQSFGSGCRINIHFQNPPSIGGFIVDKIYTTSATEKDIRPYNYDNTLNYCFSNDGGSTCNNVNFDEMVPGWEKHSMNSQLSIDIPSSSPFFERVQLTAIGNSELGFKFSMSDQCTSGIRLWQLRASATCSATYRAKEVIVPDSGISFSIFNYVLFNGTGNLTSAQQ